MSASLRDLQRRFAAELLSNKDVEQPTAVYRNTTRVNYRNALGAPYRVVRALVGEPFFDAAVDTFVAASPPRGGDLNVYGADFADFLAAYPYGRELAYLPDVARLEWALDDAARAADADTTPEDLLTALAAVPADAVSTQRFTLEPSCHLLFSEYPVMLIWQAHHDAHVHVDLGAGRDHLLVRREGSVPLIERIGHANYAFLLALDEGRDLAAAFGQARGIDNAYDLGAALGAFVGNGTLCELR
jgi:hypothetical protein